MFIAIEILTVLATLAIVVLIRRFLRDVQSRGDGDWGSSSTPAPQHADSYRVRLR
jgi:hypothetical protein